MNDERFDGLLLNMAQQHQGIDALLDSMFGFLRRKTDFFTGTGAAGARDALLRAYERQERVVAASLKQQKPKTVIKEVKEPKVTVVETPEEVLARETAELTKRTAGTDAEVIPGDEAEGESAEDKGQAPNSGNGGTGPGYVWTQVLAEVEVRVPILMGTRARALDVQLGPTRLRVAYRNAPNEPLIDGPLFATVRSDDSVWTIEDSSVLVLTLSKQNQMEWWTSVVQG
eukprot:TRINITY_DN2658_c0_g1_i1.p1 TRINITY_DN2658_c0_g1~~TRINITY_DN2658_c0_g1_i1.p1  ORF type:complete len:228 (+),score=84.97 TRINITY_DN2658_c0_g1_i1:40-723(+)